MTGIAERKSQDEDFCGRTWIAEFNVVVIILRLATVFNNSMMEMCDDSELD